MTGTLSAAGKSLLSTRSAGLTWTWALAASGELDIDLSGGQISIGCVFPLAGGSDVVASGALNLIPVGSGEFSVIAQASPTLSAGVWSITLLARTPVVDASGASYGCSVIYQ